MRRLRYGFSVITLLAALFVYCIPVQAKEQPKVLEIRLQEEIMPGTARVLSKAFEEAGKRKATHILIRMNTYGGELLSADSMRSTLLRSQVPVIVLVENNAASAGALIAMASNRIYMLPGSSIGAATVVNQNAEVLPDKYQSYMRSMMRSTAETRGRDPRIAEAMVDGRVVVEGLNDSGRVVTLTATEAVKWKVCEAVVISVEDVLKAEHLENAQLVKFTPSFIDKFISWLMQPAVSGILILLMLGGLYYEFQHPGIGLPLIIAIAAAILYFAPMYLEGLAQNWEILLVIAGIGLLLAEIFVIPGFGIAGISGIILLITGLLMSMLPNKGFDFGYVTSYSIYSSVAIILLSMSGVLILFLLTSKMVASGPFARKFSLQTEMPASAGYSTAIYSDDKIGAQGKAVTDLRPSGKVDIDGVIYPAVAESGYIKAGDAVTVINNRPGLVVRMI